MGTEPFRLRRWRKGNDYPAQAVSFAIDIDISIKEHLETVPHFTIWIQVVCAEDQDGNIRRQNKSQNYQLSAHIKRYPIGVVKTRVLGASFSHCRNLYSIW